MTRRPLSRRLVALALLAFALLAAWPAQAQVNVSLQIKRRLFMIHEPILATVSIANQSGRDIVLADTTEGGPWFSFQITANEGRQIPPRNPNYELPPLQVKAGETVKRTVNLNELYNLGDYGTLHVKSSIFFAPIGKYFASKTLALELTEGNVIWKQTVGTPEGVEGDQYRTYTLLTLEQDGGKMLYVRLQGQGDGTVYGCYNLGRMVTGFKPDTQFDSANNLAILTLVSPKTYSLSRIGLDGTFLSQNSYITAKSQPFLRKTAGGALQIVGATRVDAVAANRPDNVPKLSDRPAGF